MLSVVRHARRFACVAMMAMVVSGNAAANFTCDGLVTYLGLTPDGGLTVAVNGYGVWSLCNLTTSFTTNGRTYTPEACRAWYAAILAAKKSDTAVILYFESSASTTNGPECTALGHWVVPNPSPYFIVVR
jgi:hypothetical protein